MRFPNFQNNANMKVVRLSALRTVRLFFLFLLFFFPWRYNPHWGLYFTALYRALASSLAGFLDHIQRHTTVGRTPLDEWSVRCRDLYLTTHNTNIHALGGIRTHDLSRRAAVDLRLRPRGHWDRRIQCVHNKISITSWNNYNQEYISFISIKIFINRIK